MLRLKTFLTQTYGIPTHLYKNNLFLIQIICCEYSKEPSEWDGSFEQWKHMLKTMDKKIFTMLRLKTFLT